MFKIVLAFVCMMAFFDPIYSYGPAESYQQVNLGSKNLGLSWGDENRVKLISILQKPIVITKAEPEIDYIAYPKYGFKYGVSDPKTGDNKEQREERDGDVVRGEYSLMEPDGTKRIVKYTADKKNGFNAEVSRIGHAIHPQVVKVESKGWDRWD